MPEQAALEPAKFGKKSKPDQADAKPQVYAKEEDSEIAWDHEILRLPRTMGCRASDVAKDIETPEQRANMVRLAKKGDAGAMEVVNRALNLMLELMGRYKVEKQLRDPQGRLLFFDHVGQLTSRKYSETVKDQNGHALRHKDAMEQRSYWGVREGADCLTAPGTLIPQPCHYRTLVEENFDDLFPRLFFLSSELDPREPDPMAAKPEMRGEYMKFLKEQTSDQGFRRRELLTWLPKFLESPVATWDGR